MLLLILQRPGGQPVINGRLATMKCLAGMFAAKRYEMEAGGETNLVHASPRIQAARRRCFLVNRGASFKASQKASCSSGVKVRVCSRAALTSRRAWATKTVRT